MPSFSIEHPCETETKRLKTVKTVLSSDRKSKKPYLRQNPPSGISSRHEIWKKSESSSLDGVAIAGSAPSEGCFGTSAPPGCRLGKIKKKDNEMRPIRRSAGLTETTNRAEKGWTFVGLYFVLCQKRCKMAENIEKNATVMNGPNFKPYQLGQCTRYKKSNLACVSVN